MKLARFRHNGNVGLALVEGGSLIDLTSRLEGLGSDMINLIKQWDTFRRSIESLGNVEDFCIDDVNLLAPIARPGKLWGMGLNYADHIDEAKEPTPEFQTWFAMAQTSVAGPSDAIELPCVSSKLDYEAELVYIIGRGGRHILQERAADAIFGYCVGNDVSVRDWQLQSGQFSIGKAFDTHAPFGPWIVTSDELDVGNLDIRCFVNDELRQSSNTRHLIFSTDAQVAHLSKAMTLEPGDVFFSGTPGGVGAAMNPPQFLKAGDRVRVEIDGIGKLENLVVDECVGSNRS